MTAIQQYMGNCDSEETFRELEAFSYTTMMPVKEGNY